MMTIDELLSHVRVAMQGKQPHRFLPEVERTLLQMKTQKDEDPLIREDLSRILGRLVLDDITFAESEIGDQLLAFADEYAEDAG
ncbi:MAG: hypothetical protein KDA86_13160 [Planctomycetaceae bacterium]|nr:hypothetical protein [Planctomycetaceae bacterium]